MKKAMSYLFVSLIAALVLVLSIPADAVPWSAAKTTGVTAVDVVLDPSTNTYTWTLRNLTSTPDSPIPDWVLVWSLQPFNVYEPIAWTAPAGWAWDDQNKAWMNYEVIENSEKWYTPPSVAPGEAKVFTYTFSTAGSKINPFDSSFTGDPVNDIGFIAHVGAVEKVWPATPEDPWTPAETSSVQGFQTWYDRSSGGFIVPEPLTLAALGFGIAPLAASMYRRRRSK